MSASQIVEEARTVILAGGTLQPISELRDRLFPELPHEKVCPFIFYIIPTLSHYQTAYAMLSYNNTSAIE